MAGDDDSDVRRALAVFGAPPIGYRNFWPVPAAPQVQPDDRAAAPAPTRLTLHWPARSFAHRAEAALGQVPAPLQPVPNLRAFPPRPAPSDSAPHRGVVRGPQAARLPASVPGMRPPPSAVAAPGHGKLPLTEVFRALAESPAAEATPLALPPMFRRL